MWCTLLPTVTASITYCQTSFNQSKSSYTYTLIHYIHLYWQLFHLQTHSNMYTNIHTTISKSWGLVPVSSSNEVQWSIEASSSVHVLSEKKKKSIISFQFSSMVSSSQRYIPWIILARLVKYTFTDCSHFTDYFCPRLCSHFTDYFCPRLCSQEAQIPAAAPTDRKTSQTHQMHQHVKETRLWQPRK